MNRRAREKIARLIVASAFGRGAVLERALGRWIEVEINPALLKGESITGFAEFLPAGWRLVWGGRQAERLFVRRP